MCRKPWAFFDSVQHFSWTKANKQQILINQMSESRYKYVNTFEILTPKLPSFEEKGELKSWLILLTVDESNI